MGGCCAYNGAAQATKRRTFFLNMGHLLGTATIVDTNLSTDNSKQVRAL
jgi:hypothetical protein